MAEDLTGNLTVDSRLKLITNIAKNVKAALGDKSYDGSSATYRTWARAFYSSLNIVKIARLEDTVKERAYEDPSVVDWDELIGESDREFLYHAAIETLTQTQVDVVENEERNGILVFTHYYRLWGAPNLSNTIAALSKLMQLRVGTHENPTKKFKELENIFETFFTDIEQVKTAWLFHLLDNDKYKDILNTLEQYDTQPTYSALKDMLISFYHRQQAVYESKKAKVKAAERDAARSRGSVYNVAPAAASEKEPNSKKPKTTDTPGIEDTTPNPKAFQSQVAGGGRGGLTGGGRFGPGRGRGSPGRGFGGRGGGRGGYNPLYRQHQPHEQQQQQQQQHQQHQQDLSKIQCYECGQYGHYAWMKDKCPNGQNQHNNNAQSMKGAFNFQHHG